MLSYPPCSLSAPPSAQFSSTSKHTHHYTVSDISSKHLTDVLSQKTRLLIRNMLHKLKHHHHTDKTHNMKSAYVQLWFSEY